MFGRGMPNQKPGTIRASTINAGLRVAGGLLKLRVGPGLGLKWLGDTPFIELLERLGVAIGRAPSAIDGRDGAQLGTGLVVLHDLAADGTLTASGRSVTAANLATDAVAADVYLILLRIGPLWLVIWEECPESAPEEPEPEPEPEPE